MITLTLLQTLLTNIVPSANIVSANGYDAVLSLLQERIDDGPIVIMEDRNQGVFSALTGGMNQYTQSVWVMDRQGRDQSPQDVKDSTYNLMVTIVQKIISQFNLPALNDIDMTRIPYNLHTGAQNWIGWEMLFSQKENYDLTYTEPPTPEPEQNNVADS